MSDTNKPRYDEAEENSEGLSPENALKLMRFLGKHDILGNLFWDENLVFELNMNDVFAWGCGDQQEITNETLDDYIKAVEEIEALVQGKGGAYGDILFAARQRGMRPQGAWLRADEEAEVKEKIYPLIRACGPPRERRLGNPYREETYRRRYPRRLADRILDKLVRVFTGNRHTRRGSGRC